MAVGFRGINVFAARAVEFDGFDVGRIAEADGEEGLLVAVYTRATAEICATVLFELRKGLGFGARCGEVAHHLGEPSAGDDESCVDQAVE